VGVKRVSKRRAATVAPITPEQLEEFYTAQYLRLVKVLVLLGATVQEAEDAVQKAMLDLWMRCRSGQTPEHPVAYVQRAAFRFFVKERQRERERLPRELQGGHLVIEAHLDDGLEELEDNQFIEHLLEFVTPVQRSVIKLIMDGLSTHEIAVELDKSDANVRQHLKNGRDRLKQHPEVAPLAPQATSGLGEAAQLEVRSTVTTPEPRKEEVQ
jgi:RNA polymerase sigma factor (sigma-70 family)